MADWTDQDTDSLLPGEPWTSAKALAAFENPVALAEGATGAPKIQAEALGAQEVNEPAMRVRQESGSFTVAASGVADFEILGNLVFLPRVTGTGSSDLIVGFGGSGLLIRNTNPNDSRTGTVSWYRIIP